MDTWFMVNTIIIISAVMLIGVIVIYELMR